MAFIAKALRTSHDLSVYSSTPKGDIYLSKAAKVTLVVDGAIATILVVIGILTLTGTLGALTTSLSTLAGISIAFGFILPLVNLFALELAQPGAKLRENLANIRGQMAATQKRLAESEQAQTSLNTLNFQLSSELVELRKKYDELKRAHTEEQNVTDMQDGEWVHADASTLLYGDSTTDDT